MKISRMAFSRNFVRSFTIYGACCSRRLQMVEARLEFLFGEAISALSMLERFYDID